jgi:hypothetical protein
MVVMRVVMCDDSGDDDDEGGDADDDEGDYVNTTADGCDSAKRFKGMNRLMINEHHYLRCYVLDG